MDLDDSLDLGFPQSLSVTETSNFGSVTCMVDSSFVGNQNVSFIINGEFGRSLQARSAMMVSADDRIYNFQTYAGNVRIYHVISRNDC